MKLNCGIVGTVHKILFTIEMLAFNCFPGLPNVGKSTLFNALVGSAAAQAANFPFCTIGTFQKKFL